MDITKYLTPLLKWWWLMVVAAIAAAVPSAYITLRQPPTYESRTTLMVGFDLENPNPSSGDFYLAQYLATLYADIANRVAIKEATRQALGLDWMPDVSAYHIANSQSLEIVVNSGDPTISKVVANEMARQLILLSPASNSSNQDRQAFINQQLDLLEKQITDTQVAMDDLQQQLGSLNSARQIADTQNQIASLVNKLNTLQGYYSNLLNTSRNAVNRLEVLEEARDGYPISTNKVIPIGLAAVVGMSLAAGAAYLMEYIDRTLRTEEDVQRVLGVPVLGYIMTMDDESRAADYIIAQPRSPIAEGFRSLRTNLGFSIAARPVEILFISSLDMGDGKTTIATNLAISLAQAEKRITLVDADLRRPSVHTRLKLPAQPGLSDAFVKPEGVCHLVNSWYEDRVMVLTAGNTPPNPAELLASNKMDSILAELKNGTDLVILDGPPFVVADANILASKADGILLVISPGQVREDAAKTVLAQIERAGSQLLGVIFNRIQPKTLKNYGGYAYYQQYAHAIETDETPNAKQKSGLTAIFSRLPKKETFTRIFEKKKANRKQ
jgi:capsular exopolysaccharide synthesis family protein